MLDKKLCQRHADPGLELDPDSGVLYARSVKYIVCTFRILMGSPS